MKPLIDIIIPTFNNVELLLSCLNSIRITSIGAASKMIRYIVVNNGNSSLKDYLGNDDKLILLEPGENLGWEGGLIYGLEKSDAPFVVFCNDDIRMVTGDSDWLFKMTSLFNDPSVGAVGPSSNFVMGPQQIFADITDRMIETKYLIGFFMMLRREALDKAGGVDATLPGGDDIDLSIRIRDSGYSLLCRRDVFVFHHGQVTGQKVHQGYWNSIKMLEATHQALIKKHGMRKFWETMVMGHLNAKPYGMDKFSSKDIEGDLCRKHVEGDSVLEVGCGGRKTTYKAIGIDLHRQGESIHYVTTTDDICVADISADGSVELPFPNNSQDTIIARHLLEHCQDPLGTLSVWNIALKMGGKLIVAVPNNGLGNTIIMNPEHVNSFTPTSLRNLASVCGFLLVNLYEDVNGVSFVAVFKKSSLPHPSINNPGATIAPKAARLEESCV